MGEFFILILYHRGKGCRGRFIGDNKHQPKKSPSIAVGVRASGTLSDGDGAAGGQHCHAERSEASRGPSRQTLRFAQGDKSLRSELALNEVNGVTRRGRPRPMESWTCVLG